MSEFMSSPRKKLAEQIAKRVVIKHKKQQQEESHQYHRIHYNKAKAMNQTKRRESIKLITTTLNEKETTKINHYNYLMKLQHQLFS